MSKGREIRWRSGSSGRISAEACYEELDRIRHENEGDLTAEIVVEEARPSDSVLHPQIFDLGQKRAAEEYYRERARHTMRALVVVYQNETATQAPETIQVRAFSTVEQKLGESGRVTQIYSSTEEALQDPTRREYILAEAIRQVAVWRKKYAALSELATIFRAIDEIAI